MEAAISRSAISRLISARTGAGIDALMAELFRTLIPAVPEPGEGVPYNSAHVAAVRPLLHSK